MGKIRHRSLDAIVVGEQLMNHAKLRHRGRIMAHAHHWTVHPGSHHAAAHHAVTHE
jgi:hypothetical protein